MVRAFTEYDLDAAAALLAERHRRHLEAEPLLPADVDFRAEVEALWHTDGAAGAVAKAGYLLGVRNADTTWAPNVWVAAACVVMNGPTCG